MNKYLLVINAGSSSIKFAIYQKDALSAQLIADAAGQIEGIGSQPSFTVKSSDGEVLVDRTLSVDEAHDHTDAITIIRAWLREYFADGTLLAVGHRVVHGGQHYSAPVLIDASSSGGAGNPRPSGATASTAEPRDYPRTAGNHAVIAASGLL